MKKKDSKPHTRTPQVWGGYCIITGELERIRMLYPDGQSDWTASIRWLFDADVINTPCWQYEDGLEVTYMKSFKKRIALMKAYDKRQGRKTIFLGNV